MKMVRLIDEADVAWLNLGDMSQYKNIYNPLTQDRLEADIEHPGAHELRIMLNPHYLGWAAKTLLGIELHPFQAVILHQMWTHAFPMLIAARGGSKTFLMGVYALLRCVLVPRTKVVIAGAAFRQSKLTFEYMATIWRDSPVLRSMYTGKSDGPRYDVDRCTFNLGQSSAIAIPIGTGEKIRGLRANVVLVDEFNSIRPDIYETVIAGFGAVSMSPIDNVKMAARRNYLRGKNKWTPDMEMQYISTKRTNQAVLSGTSGYDFEHFADYWRKWRGIIYSRGDERKLKDTFGSEDIPKNFNYKDYCIVRLPYALLPEGFMDDATIAKAQATMHTGIYSMEYGAVFAKDSQGFFRRSLIQSCVGTDIKPVVMGDGSEIWFEAMVRGNPTCKYVYGIDPASEQDNFSIIIIEVQSDHNRVVYAWTTNKADFNERLKRGLVQDHDYYSFCARKIRDLMKTFPTDLIGIDSQGGGIAISEALHDPRNMIEGEQLLWPTVDPDKKKDTDLQTGSHILELVNFAKADWTSEANHGLRKDMEDKFLLFPRFDPMSLALSAEHDKMSSLAFKKAHPDKTFYLYDSLEDCVMDIEELKDELCTIVLTKTGTGGSGGRDRWDTPEYKTPEGKKGRLRKDRYSALVIANMLARQIQRAPPSVEYEVIGDFTQNISQEQQGAMYNGPDWFTKGMDGGTTFGVVKRG